MIISDKYKFAFVHIPKCAGTSLKEHLRPYENPESRFPKRGTDHPGLGRLDYAHIPLFTLKDFFPDQYEKVNSHWSFSVTRDPYKRFSSSLSQRLKMYCGTPIQYLTKKEIIREVDNTIDILGKNSSKNTQLPFKHIFFQRQVDYIYLNDKKIIDSVFAIDEINILLEQFYKYIDHEMPAIENRKKSNQSIVFKNDLLRRFIVSTRPFTQFGINRMSGSLKEKLRSIVYVPGEKSHSDIFQSDFVTDFITDYYKDDITLVAESKK